MRFQGYRLFRGRYVAMRPDVHGRVWSQQLGLSFGVHERKLRLFFADGTLVPEPNEAADQEKARAEQEKARADREKDRADREKDRADRADREKAHLIAQLRRLGLDPETWQ